MQAMLYMSDFGKCISPYTAKVQIIINNKQACMYMIHDDDKVIIFQQEVWSKVSICILRNIFNSMDINDIQYPSLRNEIN